MEPNIGFILRETTPPALDIQAGLFVEVLGDSSETTFDVRAGGGVQGLDAGATVNLEGASSDFTLVRNGTTLEIRDGNGVLAAQVAGGTQASTVRFADGAAELSVDTLSATLSFAGQTFEDGDSVVAAETGLALDAADTSVPAFDDDPTNDPVGGDSGEGTGGGGGDPALSGQVLVDGASVTSLPDSAGTLTLGDDAAGQASVDGGRTLTFTSDGFDNVTLGAQVGGDGLLTLRDLGTRLVTAGTDNTVQVGRVGEGTLNVENGAEVNTAQFEVGRQGTGTATIDGDGSKVIASNDNGLFSGEFALQAGFVRIGRKPDSEGTVTVSNGGELEVRPGEGDNSDTSGPGISLGQELESRGTLVVDGQGSEVDIRQESPLTNFGPFLEIGEGLGQGHVTVRNDARLSLDGPFPFIGVSDAEAGGSGSRDTTDVNAVEQSALRIESGGNLEVSDDRPNGIARIAMAQRTGADGALVVTGNGSEINLEAGDFTEISLGGFAGIPVAGFFGTNSGGTGVMLVADGAEITGLTLLNLGQNAGGTGSATVTGDGTEIAFSGDFSDGSASFMQVGRNGTGNLTVDNGARITFDGGTGNFPGFNVGRNAGSDGSLLVDGDGSEIVITGEGQAIGGGSGFIRVGNAGDGIATIRDGGRLINDEEGETFVGVQPNGEGILTVTGADSTLNAGDRLLIGANFDFDTGDIGLDQGGDGTVEILTGASLISDVVVIGQTGTLRLDSGTTIDTEVENRGGLLQLGQGIAQVQIDGDFLNEGSLTFDIAGTGQGDFDTLEIVNGDAQLAGDVTFAFTGGANVEAGDSFELVTATEGLNTSGLTTSTTGLDDSLDVNLVTSGGTLTLEVVNAFVT